jgi:hypothetical protein
MIHEDVIAKYHIATPLQSLEALKILSKHLDIPSLGEIGNQLIKNNAIEPISIDLLDRLINTRFIKQTLINSLKQPVYIFTFDGCFNDGTNAKVYTRQGIILLAKPICSNAITEIFLHELGHMHHVSKTSDITVCPESFLELLEHPVIKSDDYLQTHWKRIAAKCPYDFTREKYADAYMIAAMSFISGSDIDRYITKYLHYSTISLFQSYFLSDNK